MPGVVSTPSWRESSNAREGIKTRLPEGTTTLPEGARESSNAREGIKTYHPAACRPSHDRWRTRESSNAREGIKTARFNQAIGCYRDRRESSNAREGIKTNMAFLRSVPRRYTEGIIERPRGH